MGELIELDQRRRALMAKKGFDGWKRRFPDNFSEDTRIEDLSDATLGALVQPGEESGSVINEFVMGVKGLGHAAQFHSLGPVEKMALTDISIFVLDQLRFECMRRLRWIETYPGRDAPLLDLVEQFFNDFSCYKNETPPLAPSHSRYTEFLGLFEGDRGAFVRKLIPEAIDIFKKRVRRDEA